MLGCSPGGAGREAGASGAGPRLRSTGPAPYPAVMLWAVFRIHSFNEILQAGPCANLGDFMGLMV